MGREFFSHDHLLALEFYRGEIFFLSFYLSLQKKVNSIGYMNYLKATIYQLI